jgi:hypothetical protein
MLRECDRDTDNSTGGRILNSVAQSVTGNRANRQTASVEVPCFAATHY